MLQEIKTTASSLYKDYNSNPFQLTDGQAEIFETIFQRKYPRVHCITYTQYGKSDTVSMSVLTRITTFPEKWAIVAPSNKKAHIIMSYIIQHIFDNEYTTAMFEVGKGESVDRIRRERSKERLTFRHPDGQIGEVFTISSEGKRTKDLLDALMGFGCFLYDEKIKTIKGAVKIGKLVESNKKIKIASYNHETEKVEYDEPLNYQKNPRGNRRIVEVDFGYKKIKCTEDHPIFVEGKGYVKAIDLISGDCVLDCSLL